MPRDRSRAAVVERLRAGDEIISLWPSIVRLPGAEIVPAGMHRGVGPEVDVYLIDPFASDEPLGTLLATLDRTERRRLLATRTAYGRRLFLASHVGLRRVLACHLGVAPASVEFRRDGGTAKPALRATMGSELQFNLSHTRGLAAVAIARGGAVGVDVEWTGRRGDVLPFVRRHFGRLELMQMERVAPDERMQEFLKLWTRREAAAKLTGEGLARTMARDEVGGGDLHARSGVYDLLLPGGEHVGALAVAPTENGAGGE